jgi:hypothetical protein
MEATQGESQKPYLIKLCGLKQVHLGFGLGFGAAAIRGGDEAPVVRNALAAPRAKTRSIQALLHAAGLTARAAVLGLCWGDLSGHGREGVMVADTAIKDFLSLPFQMFF